jgi:uncharacterized protein YycO
MEYSLVRDGLRNGDVLAFRYDPKSFFSQLISFRTRSRISHVGILVRFYDRLCVVEALEGRGVRVFPVSTLLKQGRTLVWYQTTLPVNLNRFAICNAALSHWGQRYASPWQFVRSFGLLTRWICDRLKIKRDTNKERFFCSEFVVTCLQEAGIDIDADPATMSPGDVIELPCLIQRGVLEWTGSSKPPS